MEDYQNTFFVLNSLLENYRADKNKDNIEKILVEYKINNLFELALNILNKSENVRFNNLLEKITCIDEREDQTIYNVIIIIILNSKLFQSYF